MKSLVRWQPLQEFTSLQRQMNRLLHAFSGETSLMPFEESLTGWDFGPPVDIYEDDQKLTFKVEVPGVDEKDIKVEIENNILTVHGERKLEKGHQGGNFPPDGTPLWCLFAFLHGPKHGRPAED